MTLCSQKDEHIIHIYSPRLLSKLTYGYVRCVSYTHRAFKLRSPPHYSPGRSLHWWPSWFQDPFIHSFWRSIAWPKIYFCYPGTILLTCALHMPQLVQTSRSDCAILRTLGVLESVAALHFVLEEFWDLKDTRDSWSFLCPARPAAMFHGTVMASRMGWDSAIKSGLDTDKNSATSDAIETGQDAAIMTGWLGAI